MTIKDSGGSTVATTTSNSSGVYAFSAFPSGSYTMSIVPAAAWGGVNSTDALLVLNHFAMVAPLSGLGLAAADVNASHTINGTDAFFVMKRYSGMISSFASGDYLYHTDTLFTSGNSVTNNFKFACYGDCNLSYAPAKKSTESVGLVHEGTISVPSFTEFDFPVKLKYGMDVGAISLGFYYPEQYLEITDARLENGNNSFSWTAADGLFRMGWADLNPLTVANDEVVVILKMKSKDLSGLSGSIAMTLYENCEFADPAAVPNDGEVVSIQDIASGITGIVTGPDASAFSVHPNPVRTTAVIEFANTHESIVGIGMYDLIGNLVLQRGEELFPAGKHDITLHVEKIPAGLYLLKISQTVNDKVYDRTVKVVVSK